MTISLGDIAHYVDIHDWLKQILSEKEFWNKWQLRFSVVLSLFLQTILIWLGKRRKHIPTPCITIVIWSAYLAAGWFATVSLSTLLRSKGGLESEFVVFWTPFLLLHLGGPDTITAYSVADNETWLRHLVGLLVQVVTAFYIYYKFRTDSPLQFIAIFVFIPGLIRYGEKIWVLRSASAQKFADFIFSDVRLEKYLPDADRKRNHTKLDEYVSPILIHNPDTRHVYKALCLLKMFTPVFLDYRLKIYKEIIDVFTVKFESAEEAFVMINTELGFLFDLLYTKTPFFHTTIGGFLRFICFHSLVIALITFSITFEKQKFSRVDIFVSYLLLVGGLLLDFHAIVSNVLSYWTSLWLARVNIKLAIRQNTTSKQYLNFLNPFLRLHKQYLSILCSLLSPQEDKERLKLIGQHNLINYCVKARVDALTGILRIFDTNNILEKYWHSSWEKVDPDIMQLLYDYLLSLQQKYKMSGFKFKILSNLLAKRGENAIIKFKDDLDWSISDVEFDHSLLIWHIATDLCYNADIEKGVMNVTTPKCEISQCLSNYMLYLLVVRPTMLPGGIGVKRHRDSRNQILNYFSSASLSGNEDARRILSDMTQSYARLTTNRRHKSVLFDAQRLYESITNVASTFNSLEEKWELINNVWMEMLIHAASQCLWGEHCQQLIHGKEFLTHVSLLMLHLGLSTQVRVAKFPTDLENNGYYPPWSWDDFSDLAYYVA
ncbi:LOW QUALITY PROTEIN: uncharacterized protein LOC110809210 [Carica papaya]|uniref:LOW QUALITY PROTEIN: uncharacterized protein LOC110809210 n=1 Tax=Carica papaya TaxID=3649 RepID=UPI000B8C96AC|nr:LOW QUALITY PROTEIN: uncharacterized protein LOC110809210 [Carica papaya]